MTQNVVTRLWGLCAAAAIAACSSAGGAPPETMPPAGSDRVARADSVRNSYVPADVEFMTDMIHHHAQALVMARMAPTHDAGGTIQVLAERIIVGQNDEIVIMQRWLRDQGEPVPDPAAGASDGGNHSMHMPGMLSQEQLAELDAARGAEFDRLFLTYMIQHHQGALTMVEQLFDTYGGAQGDLVFKIASDIGADQTSEIDRMRSMLREMVFENPSSR
ncbi:DUF305 domain-containing protein [soil metagenome]